MERPTKEQRIERLKQLREALWRKFSAGESPYFETWADVDLAIALRIVDIENAF
jgi:hypothetical protein